MEWFNRLSYLVATEICMVRTCLLPLLKLPVGCFHSGLTSAARTSDNCPPFPFALQPVKKKHRARMIEYFIDVARECFNIGNFNSLMAIICESLVFVGPVKCRH